MILFDPATARDLVDALRLLEGRLAGTDRRLSDGALEIFRAAEASGGVSRVQPIAPTGECVDDATTLLELFTLDEVVGRLRLSESTVDRLVRDGRLPVVRVGRNVRVRPNDLATFIESLDDDKSSATITEAV